jgi:hypothetical protein
MKQNASELELKKDIDLGLIIDTTIPLELFIPIKNTSNRVITIHNVAKDCSCISVKLDKWKLQPGEVATLRYSANIGGRTDRFASDVVIESDAQERFDEIVIRGLITGQVRVRPSVVTTLTGAQESPGQFTVFCDDQSGQWNYKGFDSDTSDLQVALHAASSSPTTSTYNGTITVPADWSKKRKTDYLSTSVTLNFTNDRIGRDLKVVVPVEVATRRKITLDPPVVTFLASGGKQTRAILVQSAEALGIEKARCPSRCITAAIHPINSHELRLEVVFQPDTDSKQTSQGFACDLLSEGKAIGSVPINVIEIQ